MRDGAGFDTEGHGASMEQFQAAGSQPWCVSGTELLSRADEAAQLESLALLSLLGSELERDSPAPTAPSPLVSQQKLLGSA